MLGLRVLPFVFLLLHVLLHAWYSTHVHGLATIVLLEVLLLLLVLPRLRIWLLNVELLMELALEVLLFLGLIVVLFQLVELLDEFVREQVLLLERLLSGLVLKDLDLTQVVLLLLQHLLHLELSALLVVEVRLLQLVLLGHHLFVELLLHQDVLKLVVLALVLCLLVLNVRVKLVLIELVLFELVLVELVLIELVLVKLVLVELLLAHLLNWLGGLALTFVLWLDLAHLLALIHLVHLVHLIVRVWTSNDLMLL